MQKQERLDAFTNALESKKHNIQHSDFRFYNLAHLPLIFKRSIECSQQCQTCNKHLDMLESMISELPEALDDIRKRKNFEKQKTSIEKHLRKNHKFHFPGYHAALGALTGFVMCILLILGLRFFEIFHMPNKLTVLILGLGILIGWFVGNGVDRKYFKRNLQL